MSHFSSVSWALGMRVLIGLSLRTFFGARRGGPHPSGGGVSGFFPFLFLVMVFADLLICCLDYDAASPSPPFSSTLSSLRG